MGHGSPWKRNALLQSPDNGLHLTSDDYVTGTDTFEVTTEFLLVTIQPDTSDHADASSIRPRQPTYGGVHMPIIMAGSRKQQAKQFTHFLGAPPPPPSHRHQGGEMPRESSLSVRRAWLVPYTVELIIIHSTFRSKQIQILLH